MPAIRPPARVLVTGANGYIASWIVLTLLQRGYTVRGTVRTTEKGECLKQSMVKRAPIEASKFEYVVVSDICEPGAFDDAVKDVDAVCHTSPHPVTHDFEDPLELIDPCLKGTVSLLESILKHGQTVKRLIFLSSDRAIRCYHPTPHIFDENDWNDLELREVEEKIQSNDASKFPPVYSASKVLAERAVWKFYEEHKNEIGWDATVFHPCLVYGPLANDKANPENLSSSILGFWFYMCTTVSIATVPVLDYFSRDRHYVDVRDVAELHARALEKGEAGGQRFIVAAGDLNWNEWLQLGHAHTPKFLGLRSRQFGAPPGTPSRVKVNNAKAKRIFGIQYKSAEEIMHDTLEDFRKRGWAGSA